MSGTSVGDIVAGIVIAWFTSRGLSGWQICMLCRLNQHDHPVKEYVSG